MSPKTTPRTINVNEHNGEPVRESDCAEVLNDHFSTVFTNEPYLIFKPNLKSVNFMPPITVKATGIFILIEKPNLSSSAARP